MKNATDTGYIARSKDNTKMLRCTDGDFHHETQCGPGGFCARVYKTQRAARAVRGGSVLVQRCEGGVPVGIAS